jgi:hypothetical protein
MSTIPGVSVSTDVQGQSVHIVGSVTNFGDYSSVTVMAANPIDRMTTYTGSGLPFPCQDMAFEGTPNIVELKQAAFNIVFKYPNSYYTYDNWTKVPPSIFVVLKPVDPSKPTLIHRHSIPDQLPLRTLNRRPGHYKGPGFLARKEYLVPMGGAEDVMRAMAMAKPRYDIA